MNVSFIKYDLFYFLNTVKRHRPLGSMELLLCSSKSTPSCALPEFFTQLSSGNKEQICRLDGVKGRVWAHSRIKSGSGSAHSAVWRRLWVAGSSFVLWRRWRTLWETDTLKSETLGLIFTIKRLLEAHLQTCDHWNVSKMSV